MATGIEAAGLVLATFPLVISALEHYANGMRTIKYFHKFERELNSVKLRLETEREILRISTRLLLQGVVTSEKDLEDLIDDPGGQLWKEKTIVYALEFKLSTSYKIYISTMEDMNEAMADLKKKLGLDPDGKCPWMDKRGLKSYLKRGKCSLMRADYEEIMERIKTDNKNLRRLTKDRNDPETPPRNQKHHYDSSFFEHVRQMAGKIFKGLATALACGCPEPHNVNLELKHRKPQPLTHGESGPSDRDLRYAAWISYSAPMDTSGACDLSLFWKEIEIGLAKSVPGDSIAQSHPTPHLSPSNINTSALKQTKESINGKRKLQKGKGKSVKWIAYDKTPAAAATGSSSGTATESALIHPEATVTGTLSILSRIPPPNVAPTAINLAGFSPIQISHLCQNIRASDRNALPGEYLAVSSDAREGCQISWANPRISGDSWWPVSLRSVLSGKSGNVPKFGRTDRIRTAVILASSVLQLPESSWLEPGWMESHLVFAQGNGPKPFKHVFISKRFENQSSLPTSMDSVANIEAMPYVRNPTIFALGIFLIELCFGQSIEALRKDTDPLPSDGRPNGLTRFSIATRLIDDEEISAELGPRYETAVRRCIFCEFSQHGRTLEEKGFQRAFYEEVVELLEEFLTDFTREI